MNSDNAIDRIVERSKDHCFSVWYDPCRDRYYADNEKTESAIWICDIDHPTSAETILRMTRLMLAVTDEYTRRGYLRKD